MYIMFDLYYHKEKAPSINLRNVLSHMKIKFSGGIEHDKNWIFRPVTDCGTWHL